MKKRFIALLAAIFITGAIIYGLNPHITLPPVVMENSGAENSAAKDSAVKDSTREIALNTRGNTFSIAGTQTEELPQELYIPILVYHRIGYAPANADSVYKSLTIEPEWLEKHLMYLREHNFQAVNFYDVANYFENNIPLPVDAGKKPVMINFDDGYKGVFDYALPLLEKYNMTATIFVITNMAGRPAYMDWDQIKTARESGLEIGSHTVWHPDLTRSRKTEFEINESKKILEEKLGEEIISFAYPSGKYNKYVEELVKKGGYKLARSYSNGVGINPANVFHIPVVKIYANVGLERWESQWSLISDQ